jgi:hypothetical protein
MNCRQGLCLSRAGSRRLNEEFKMDNNQLIARMDGKIVECFFIIDLLDIGGHARLEKHGHKVFALCEFEGD